MGLGLLSLPKEDLYGKDNTDGLSNRLYPLCSNIN